MTAIGPWTRVVCIKDGRWECDALSLLFVDGSGPTKGSKWTVSSVVPVNKGIYLALAEWPEAEAAFLAAHFKPVDDGMDILRRIAREAMNPDLEMV